MSNELPEPNNLFEFLAKKIRPVKTEYVGTLSDEEINMYNNLIKFKKELEDKEAEFETLKNHFWSIIEINHKAFGKTLKIDLATHQLLADSVE